MSAQISPVAGVACDHGDDGSVAIVVNSFSLDILSPPKRSAEKEVLSSSSEGHVSSVCVPAPFIFG